MNALRIHKRIDGPIPGMPELTPLVGKTVDIIVTESPALPPSSESTTSQRIRLAGVVQSIDRGGSALALSLDSGELLDISWGGAEPLLSSELLGQRVAVDALALFSSEGEPMRIEADAIAAARPEDAFFSQPPRRIGRLLNSSDLHKPQGTNSGLARVFGAWPGDESDEQVLRALEEVE